LLRTVLFITSWTVIFAARLIRSYMGYVPEMPSIQLSSCMREIDPLTYFPVGRAV
jgi:hypothetical protein